MTQPTHKLLAPTSEDPFGSLQDLPTMSKPNFEDYKPNHLDHIHALEKYYAHMAALKKFSLTSELKGVKVGDLVTKDLDFKEQYEDCHPGIEGWNKRTKEQYEASPYRKRIVAIPLEKEFHYEDFDNTGKYPNKSNELCFLSEKEKIDTPAKGIEETQDRFPEIWHKARELQPEQFYDYLNRYYNISDRK